MELRSMTAMAEYVDILFTHLCTEFNSTKHRPLVQHWKLELEPPMLRGDGNPINSDESDTVCLAIIRVHTNNRRNIFRVATFKSAEKGVAASNDIMQTVVEHHIAKLLEELYSDE